MQAFVALSTGVVKTFDLLCLRNSPYVVPNVWTRYEEKMLASGLPAAPSPGSYDLQSVIFILV